MSLKEIIYNYIKSQYPLPVHKGEILRKSVNEWGYESETAGRRCRDLEKEKVVERVWFDKGCVGYRWIPQEPSENIPIPIKDEPIKLTAGELLRRAGVPYPGRV